MELSTLLLSTLMGLTAQPARVSTYELPAVAGLWQVEDGLSCQERYNFGRDARLTTTSAGERTEGEYRFRYPSDRGLPVLAMVTHTDNNEPDCSGNQIDQSGNTMAVFVRLDNRHSPKMMQWCVDSDAGECPVRLRRILP